jgi:hypothetical protein
MSTFWTDVRLSPTEFHKSDAPSHLRTLATSGSLIEEIQLGHAGGTVSRRQFMLAAGIVVAIIASGIYLASHYLLL